MPSFREEPIGWASIDGMDCREVTLVTVEASKPELSGRLFNQ